MFFIRYKTYGTSKIRGTIILFSKLIIFIFRVECFECDGNYNDCNPCNGNVKFDQSPDEISEDGRGSNQLKVSNLDSEAFYKFKVNFFSGLVKPTHFNFESVFGSVLKI